MADSWGEGDARVAVGDVVMVSSQFDRRGSGQREGVVVKIGRTLLHVNEHGQVETYYLASQRMTGQYSGSWQTKIQYAKAERRRRTVDDLAGLGIVCGSGGSIFQRDWADWSTDQLIELADAAARIRDSALRSDAIEV